MAEHRKRAFLVLAPESHGGHLVSDLLVHAGCHGHSGNHVPWRPETRRLGPDDDRPWDHVLPTDVQPWDRSPPTGEDPIVWRRSLPHGKAWVDIGGMIGLLRGRGYAVTALVVSRDRHCALQSQLKWRHVEDLETGKANIERAWRHIFAHLERAAAPFVVVSYEALVSHREARERLLESLGLTPPPQPLEVWDGNRKWYAPAERCSGGGGGWRDDAASDDSPFTPMRQNGRSAVGAWLEQLDREFTLPRDLMVDVGAGKKLGPQERLIASFARAYLVEPEPGRFRLLERAAAAHRNIVVVNSDARSLTPELVPFGKADLVMSKFVVQHLPSWQREPFFAKLVELARPGGWIALFVASAGTEKPYCMLTLHAEHTERCPERIRAQLEPRKADAGNRISVRISEAEFDGLFATPADWPFVATRHFTFDEIAHRLAPHVERVVRVGEQWPGMFIVAKGKVAPR